MKNNSQIFIQSTTANAGRPKADKKGKKINLLPTSRQYMSYHSDPTDLIEPHQPVNGCVSGSLQPFCKDATETGQSLPEKWSQTQHNNET